MPDEVTGLRLLHDVRDGLTRRLVAWGAASVVAGAGLAVVGRRRRDPLITGVGRQFVGWGAVDLVIAGVGAASNRRPVTDVPAALRSLRRLLIVNAVLDVGYIGAAAVLAGRRERQGDALGVVVQALALLVLDVGHARRLSRHDRG